MGLCLRVLEKLLYRKKTRQIIAGNSLLTTISQISQIFSKIGNRNKTHLGDGAVLEGVGDIDSRSWSDLSSSGTEKIEKKPR